MKRYLLDTSLIATFLHGRSTALEHDLTLLTIDTDYDRVPQLKHTLANLKKAA